MLLGQLVINYGEATYSIPWAYIAYFVGSFVIPWGIIRTGKATNRKIKHWRAAAAERREHRRIEADRELQRHRRAQEEQELLEQRQHAEKKAAKEKEINDSLPGVWRQAYDSIREIGDLRMRADVLTELMRGNDESEISPKNNPLPPKGADLLLGLLRGGWHDSDEAFAKRINTLKYYMPKYVAAWMELKQKISGINWDKVIRDWQVEFTDGDSKGKDPLADAIKRYAKKQGSCITGKQKPPLFDYKCLDGVDFYENDAMEYAIKKNQDIQEPNFA